MFKQLIKEELKVPAEISHLGEMRDFVTRVGRKYGVSERIINAFKLAIDEAGTNIIRHAYRDWEGFITIQMLIRDKSVTITLIDQGHAFDPNNVKDPDLQRYVEIGKKGGLGIFIIRRVIDHIDYRKTVNGNELRLTKSRDVSPRKSVILPELSLTMKTRFSLIASGILSFFVLLAFVWNYVQQDRNILKDHFSEGRAIARSMVNVCRDHLAQEETWELARISAEVQREYAPLVLEALVVDSTGLVQGAMHTDLLLMPFQDPDEINDKAEDVVEYRMPGVGPVYAISEIIMPEAAGSIRPLGEIHLLLDKTYVDNQIRSARRRVLWLSALVLMAGYGGIFLLVYMTMIPFKRLAKWVRELGQGEVKDEIDFDASDEVGEIALAFNEITEKFRKSQESLAEQERLQKEMQVAQEIQHTLLPAAFPDIEGYEIASYYEAAKEVGGDYFDFVEVDRDTLGIVVADVSGKGVPGSLVMTMIRTALRTEARGNKNAADVLARVNDFVINDMKRGMFVTVFYIILDSQNRTINYASAGHNPMILYRGSTKKSYYLNPKGFPIGINLPDKALFRKSIESDTLRLKEGDVLISYTDGITEAMNPLRDKFSEERFLEVVRKNGHLKVDPLVDKIRDEINVFTEGYAQNDDITLVAIREKMRAEDVLFNLRSRLMKMVNEDGMTVKEACKTVGVSTSTYYKYKKRFDKMGSEGLKEKVSRSNIEEKHISVEEKAKIYDIIKEHPEYGAKRISEELNTDKYGHSQIDERKIYEELVRSRLNTKELRVAFVERGGHRKRMKPPGTPFLTLDGQVIVGSRETTKHGKDETEAGLEEKKAASGMRVSQGPEKEKVAPHVDGKAETTDVLDEFLGLGETSEEIIEKEDKALQEEVLSDSEEMADDSFEKLEVDEEAQKDEAPAFASEEGHENGESMGDDILYDLLVEPEESREKTGEEKRVPPSDGEEEKIVPADLGIDEVFDEMMEGIVGIGDDIHEEDAHGDRRDRMGQILGGDEEGTAWNFYENRLEEDISSSIAEDLFDDEMSRFDITEVDEREGSSAYGLGMELAEDLHLGAGRTSWDTMKEKALEIGLQLYRKGMYSEALTEFQKVLKKHPHWVETYQCIGDAYFRMGLLDEAKEAYERVKRLDPRNIDVLENLGVIFANRGDYKKAVWQWGEVLKYNPERRDVIDRIKKMQRVIRQRYL